MALFLAFWVVVAAHVTAIALGSLLVRLPVKGVVIGFGPGPRFHLGAVFIRLSILPFGGHVAVDMQRAARWQRAVSSLLGPLLLLAGALALGAPLGAFLRGFSQAIMGAVSIDTGAELLAHLFELTDTVSWSELVGLIATKVAAFNLLPFAGSNGQEFLKAIAPERWTRALTTLGFVVLILLLLGWGAAGLSYAFG